MADEALLAGARVHPTRLTRAGFFFAHPHLDEALAAILG
jgi:NAD dependent epimerase/dehydratase family enzyme